MLWCNELLQNKKNLQHHQQLFQRLLNIKQLSHTYFYGPIGSGKQTILFLYLQHIFNLSIISFDNYELPIPNSKKKLFIKKNNHFQLINLLLTNDKTIITFLIKYLHQLIKSKTITGTKHIFILENTSCNKKFNHFLKFAIDKYSHNVVFIINTTSLFSNLNGYFMNIRIPQIKFENMNLILNTIYKIKMNKKIKLNKKTLQLITKISQNNLSKAITFLQLKKNNKNEYKQYIQRYNKLFAPLLKLISIPYCCENIYKFRNWIYQYCVLFEVENFINNFSNYLLQLPEYISFHHSIIHIASSIDHRMNSSKKMICYEYFLIKLNILFTK